MAACCDLEVDVNGEQTFFVHKDIISLYCGKIRNLFCKSKGITKNLKVILHNFPGGPATFELVSKFCYNHGKISITPYTAPHLLCAAHYMEMNEKITGARNLLEQTERSIVEIKFWSWPDLLSALKSSQELVPVSSSSGLLQKCLDSVAARLVYTSETGTSCPSISSPESSGRRLSTDSKSTESLRSGLFRSTWWFEDIATILTPMFVTLLVKSMVLHKFDHGVTSRFLFYYQKSRFIIASVNEKREITEAVIESLCLLDQSMISCKNLFEILRVALSLNMKKICKEELERMIGVQLDQATLDNLLIPSPHGSHYLYDINLVLQFVKYFLERKGGPGVPELKNVARLIDLYVTEVAADPRLKPSKFMALTKALPESARDSYDDIYHAIDIYLRVHNGLSDEEKTSMCSSLDYNKLSTESINHLTQNDKFPPKFAALALKDQQLKLESLFRGMDLQKRRESMTKDERHEQVVLYAEKTVPGGSKVDVDIVNENEKMRAHLEGMQWRVNELEKVCRKMQTQMTKILKSKLSRQTSAKSLPRFCS
ncbi:BTB/POZ domain-containing protein At3g22104-like [Rutidosis leptorrhynchoides]|uniref:BTB/POZ domain-containing protein At3g22104-like n=1 Tax=Rutidosis leptorrhynchoides TaxID=125765 RepID=UPI003A991F19